MKIYHIYLLLLVFILLLAGCSVPPSVDQSGLVLPNDSIKQEARLGRILHDRALQRLGETHPEAYVLYKQARAIEVQGDIDIAIETYHKAMQKAPESGLLLTGLGMAYLRNEDIVPARRYLLKAVNYDPDYYKSRLGLGYIYLQNKQLQKAITQLEKSLDLLPTVQGAFLLAEAEEGTKNLQRARQLYQTVVYADKNGKLGKTAVDRLRSLEK